MPSHSRWGSTPRQSIERECARRGRAGVVDGCRALTRGESVDAALLMSLGGPGAERFLDGHERADRYWLRVWGARGLLWAWDDAATEDIRGALADESWRVREMALKLIARNQVGALVADVAQAQHDSVARVRQAAHRALAVLTSTGA